MNFLLVADEVYRSRQPEPEEYDEVKEKFPVVLMFEGDTREIAALAPTLVVSRPISFFEMHVPWCAIKAQQLEDIVTLAHNEQKPLLVHCLEGVDRTGLFCAAYRVKYCAGWTPEDAMDEAVKLGYHEVLNQGLNKTWRDWLKEFPVSTKPL